MTRIRDIFRWFAYAPYWWWRRSHPIQINPAFELTEPLDQQDFDSLRRDYLREMASKCGVPPRYWK